MDISKQDVMNMFATDTAEELAKKYSAEQLRTYYNILYSAYPGRGLRKADVVRAIQKMKRGIDRAISLKP